MAIHWKIVFKPLRQAGKTYTVNIYDAAYSGSAIPLVPGSVPFTTEEDNSEDEFTPIRTQSGYLRIVDAGMDANGNAFDWKTLLPSTDTDRPVTLTDENGNLLWMGFMQAQNFGGVLYGNPQEREFPVQCCLAVTNSYEVATDEDSLNNFAYLLKNILVTRMPFHTFTSFVIQGGTDARAWLLKKFDWNDFLTEDEDSGEIKSKYSLFEVLQDFCQFWGWTVRTHQTTVYLTAMDDSSEQTLLTLTPTQLGQLADESDTSAGTVSSVAAATALSGDIFASVNNDIFQDRGPNKATVKAVVNKNDVVAKVFPASVEKSMETNGYTWVQTQGQDLVGYFETVNKPTSFNSPRLSGSNNSNYCYFSRRQIFSTKESENATVGDMMVFKDLTGATPPYISLQTKKAMAFAGGSLILGGTIYFGYYVTNWNERARIKMRIGIGMTRNTARWWYMDDVIGESQTISKGWSAPGTMKSFYAGVLSGTIQSTSVSLMNMGVPLKTYNFNAIPVPNEANLYGYLFIDFMFFESNGTSAESFEIADFSAKFSRDTIVLPTTLNEVRGREVVDERVVSKEYTSNNQNSSGDEWNADCIFASDNNMEYGYGLLMNANGTFMETVPYGNSNEHPEQHLANRVTAYWASAKTRATVELRSDVISEPTPVRKLTLDGITFYPIAISHDWRDSVTRLTMIQI